MFTQNIAPFALLVISYVAMIIGSTLLPLIAAIKQNRPDNYIIAGVVGLIASGYLTSQFFQKRKSPIRIESIHDGVRITTVLGKEINVVFSEIKAIRKFFLNRLTVQIDYNNKNQRESFLINLDLLFEKTSGQPASGNLLEMILANATNVCKIDIDSCLDAEYQGKPAWGKTPDWAIINTAKRRAEENRKKALTPAPQASPAASAPPLAGGAPVTAEADTTRRPQ